MQNGLEFPGEPPPTVGPGNGQLFGLYLISVDARALFRLKGPAGGAAARAGQYEWGQAADWTGGTYTPTPLDSGPTGANYSTSPWVTVRVGVATRTGFNATATLVDCFRPAGPCPELVCVIFVGDAPPPFGNPQEGAPLCEKRRHH